MQDIEKIQLIHQKLYKDDKNWYFEGFKPLMMFMKIEPKTI